MLMTLVRLSIRTQRSLNGIGRRHLAPSAKDTCVKLGRLGGSMVFEEARAFASMEQEDQESVQEVVYRCRRLYTIEYYSLQSFLGLLDDTCLISMSVWLVI